MVIVFTAPEKTLEVIQAQSEQDAVNISCKALGLFPEPRMSLFKVNDLEQR